MKKIIIILFCCIAKTLFGQDLPNSGFEKVRLLEPGKEIVAEIRVPNKNVHAKKDLFYAWYQANAIHSTQGGYSGKLLNGQYTEYYPNKNLKEQGAYKNGFKNRELARLERRWVVAISAYLERRCAATR